MSQTQYNQLISNLLNEKHALAKSRAELEGRKGKLCRCCKKFRHLARNCRNRRGEEKGTIVSQNKFEVLRSRIMQYGEGERTIRRMGVVEVECFECREKGHKCREYPLWIRRKNEERAAHSIKGKAQQEEWKRSSWETLRKRAEWYCGPTVP